MGFGEAHIPGATHAKPTNARSSDPDANEYRAYFKEFTQPENLYSAMVRANFPDLV